MNIVNTQFCHLLFHIFLIHVVVDGTFSKKTLSLWIERYVGDFVMVSHHWWQLGDVDDRIILMVTNISNL